MKPLPSTGDCKRHIVPILIALLAGGLAPVSGAEAAQADFFEVIGMSPAEVAVALPQWQDIEDTEQLSYGFVGLPMSDGHRKEFIASLQTASAPPHPGYLTARSCLLNLLEEDGRSTTLVDEQANAALLRYYEGIRGDGEVFVSTRKACCPQCAELAGQVVQISEALAGHILPSLACTASRCRCTWRVDYGELRERSQ